METNTDDNMDVDPNSEDTGIEYDDDISITYKDAVDTESIMRKCVELEAQLSESRSSLEALREDYKVYKIQSIDENTAMHKVNTTSKAICLHCRTSLLFQPTLVPVLNYKNKQSLSN